MEGEERRKRIIEMLISGTTPISGSEFAKELGVSRQVIVQDIALLRANNKNILSTTRGYVMYVPDRADTKVRRTFAVSHEDSRMQEELYLIVDCGGTVLDVVVEHDVYGQINGDLLLSSRQEVDRFIERISCSRSQSLLTLTQGDHFHTVEAADESALDMIEQNLKEKGFLR